MSTADYSAGGWFDADFAGGSQTVADTGDPIPGPVELVEVPRIDHVARALERLPHSLARLP